VGGETKIECGRKCESARQHKRQTETEGWMMWERERKHERERERESETYLVLDKEGEKTARESNVQCVAVCCSVLQCGAVWCSVGQCGAVRCILLQCAAVFCSVL